MPRKKKTDVKRLIELLNETYGTEYKFKLSDSVSASDCYNAERPMHGCKSKYRN